MRYVFFFLSICLSISSRAEPLAPCQVLHSIEGKVSKLRELSILRKTGCTELSHKEYIKRTDALNQKINALADLKLEEKIYKAMGIIPEGYPYAECNYYGLGDTSVAFYDYERKALIFRKGVKVAYSIIAHELVHALQDQHFHIARLMMEPLTTDSDLAAAAVREGDAMVMEDLYKDAYGEEFTTGIDLQGSGYKPECEPPRILQDINIFPYDWGKMLMGTQKEKFGFKGVNTLIQHPPCRTTQLFYAGEKQCSILQKRDTVHFRDSLGEFVLRRTLEDAVSKGDAILAAKGLAGDQITARKTTNNFVITWSLQFQSNDQMNKAVSVLRAYIAHAMKSGPLKESMEISLESSNLGSFTMTCRDETCVLVRVISNRSKKITK